ncbi:RNA polymerase sigma factor [Agromyces archimandritae]|uniref:Sigma-70 family RNA polymerase sigma factor n=1 Tax=Agromyces archimandritae TaxID=2781962 RepID=A0A975FQJ8_9MICO|nr:sigma-70 family RNA polymerase sigma factor [Agromyces archimandritae]
MTQQPELVSDSAALRIDDLVRSLSPALLAYFARRVVPQEDAADCLSETLLVLWRRRADLPKNEDDRRAWAYGVARRVLLAQRRGGARQAMLAARIRDELRTTPIAADVQDGPAIKALSRLKERDRELVGMVVWDGLSVSEAGAALGLRPDAARARYSRARRRLRAALNRRNESL